MVEFHHFCHHNHHFHHKLIMVEYIYQSIQNCQKQYNLKILYLLLKLILFERRSKQLKSMIETLVVQTLSTVKKNSKDAYCQFHIFFLANQMGNHKHQKLIHYSKFQYCIDCYHNKAHFRLVMYTLH